MKRKTLTALTLILSVGLFVTFTNCNSGSKSKSASTISDAKSTSELTEGVFEFVPPFQGYVIYLDNRFLVMMGMSDSTMFCNGGKSEISGDTITDIKLFSTNPNQVGSTQPWIAELLQGDTLKATLFNKDGSISGVVKMVKKVNLTDEMKSQMKDFEGFFQYVAPMKGLSTNLAGYYIYLFGQSDSTMTANAGTYEYQGDTFACKYQFSTDPKLIGGEFSWVNQSSVRDTFTFAVLNEAKDISGIGRSVRVK